VVVNAGSIADAAQLLIEAMRVSVSLQDARPSSRRRMAAANVRTGHDQSGVTAGERTAVAVAVDVAAVAVAAAGVKSHQFFYLVQEM
jgi:hypothetical protein